MRKWNLQCQREDCALLRDKKEANHWLHMEPRKRSLVILLCLSPKRAAMDLEASKSLQEVTAQNVNKTGDLHVNNYIQFHLLHFKE